ncbi:hypothetical protein [Anaerococcus lactolyticus]|uniref:hypothetical protein n=1 Tax=Anaerococcus lactolyticus TaxID=33032 RepID=UPI0023F0D331|nr:hypothetical protein [Anaerococcus lactolyticus]
MDLIFRGVTGIAINPDFIYIHTISKDDKKQYQVRARYIRTNTCVELSDEIDSLEKAIDFIKGMYLNTINLAASLKEIEKTSK